MHTKKLLDLNLNYAHKNLSAAFRIASGVVGTIILITGILSILYSSNTDLLNLINAIICIGLGGIFVFFATKYLPNFLKRFFHVDEEILSYKTNVFTPKRTLLWKDIEEIEIDKTLLKIRLEANSKAIIVYLGIVSYQDYELLQKAIVDLCLDKEIDLK